jgi:hypothetical protein
VEKMFDFIQEVKTGRWSFVDSRWQTTSPPVGKVLLTAID